MTVKTSRIFIKAAGTALLTSLGLQVAGCATGVSPAAAVHRAGGALAPVSMKGKTVVLHHNFAEGNRFGTECPDFNQPGWQMGVSWSPATGMEAVMWRNSIPFTDEVATIADSADEKTVYTYKRLSDKEAEISGTTVMTEDEQYSCGTLKMTFISPTTAVAEYVSMGTDPDVTYFRKVIVTLN